METAPAGSDTDGPGFSMKKFFRMALTKAPDSPIVHCNNVALHNQEIGMNLKIENSISEIAGRARHRYDEALESVRKNTTRAAGRVTRGKKPVRTISRYGVKFSGVSHRTVNKLWKRQTKLVEDQIDAVADHLKAAAHAENVKDFVRTQIDMIPDNASRLGDEARQAFEIVSDAGSEIRGLVQDAVFELRGGKPVVRKAVARARKPEAAAKETSEQERAA